MGQIVGISVVWFIIEMLIWYLVAQFISGWWVFLWFIVAAVIGISLIRRGMKTLNPMAQKMKAGGMPGMMNPAMRPPEQTMIKTIGMAAAGFITDSWFIVGFIGVARGLTPVKRSLKTWQTIMS